MHPQDNIPARMRTRNALGSCLHQFQRYKLADRAFCWGRTGGTSTRGAGPGIEVGKTTFAAAADDGGSIAHGCNDRAASFYGHGDCTSMAYEAGAPVVDVDATSPRWLGRPTCSHIGASNCDRY